MNLHEYTPAENFRYTRNKPEWLDERTRLYTGITFNSNGRQFKELLAHFDGEKTTLYVTDKGFNVSEAYKNIHEINGPCGAYRRCVTEFFRKQGIEVSFA